MNYSRQYAGFGVGSRFEVLSTKLQANAGLVAATAFSAVRFVVLGLAGSQTLDLRYVGWSFVALGG